MKQIRIKDIVTAVGGELLCGEEDAFVTSVSTNSKEIEPGALFVPIIGERVDAHKFIEGAISLGAVATFTSRHNSTDELKGTAAYIRVDDTLKALQDFAAYYRSLFSVPVIGITGSVGKTTTKEMVAAALETRHHVLKTAGNMNSQVGLPLMMFQITDQTEIAVIEMGMSEVGEMKRLAKIARPETAIMTNIGVSHIGQLGSRENIRKEKLNIINQMTEDGHLYVNNDDDLLTQIKRDDQIDLNEETKQILPKVACSYYGMNENADAYAKDIKTVDGHTKFTFVWKGKEEEITLSVLGIHNVGNALAALMVAQQYGIDPSVAKEGLMAYAPIAMRGQIYEHNGYQVIDDTYNASPDSIKSGINVLLELEAPKRRVAVLADVLELGAVSKACHYEVGEYVGTYHNQTKKVDILVTIGCEAKEIKRGALEQNPKLIAKDFDDNKEAISYLKQVVQAGDGILIKGSRGMHLEEIVNALKEA